MHGYKEPGFQERAEAAARARSSALEKLRARPAVSQAELERRVAAQADRDAAAAEKRAAVRQAREEEAAKKAEKISLAAEQLIKEAKVTILTEAERKAARDARYAERKSRRK